MKKNFKKGVCAIIGSNGYLGKHLSGYLSKMEYQVYNYDIQQSSELNNYNQIDIRKIDQFDKLPSEISCIFHMSGITGTHKGFSDYREFIETNEIGLLNLLTYIKNTNPNIRVIFPSSRLVYRGFDRPLKEEDEKDAKTIYAVNKLASELLLKIYNLRFGIPFYIFRICIPYGNCYEDNYSFGTIGAFLEMAKNRQNIVLFGDGTNKRTFTFINDVCFQIFSIIETAGAENEIYNIAGETYTLEDVAKLIAARFKVSVDKTDWNKEDLIIESGHTYFDADKISNLVRRPVKTKLTDWVNSL